MQTDRYRALRMAATCAAIGVVLAPSADARGRVGDLPRAKVLIRSTERIDLGTNTATLPLHRGSVGGKTVWYVITDVSDARLAHRLGLNFAPRLAHIARDCPGCLQHVRSAARTLGRAPVRFAGAPDFAPTRTLVPGPKGFPPISATPGGIGLPGYSPFVQIRGTRAVYNAPIVATGEAPADVVRHTDTQDRVMAIDTRAMTVRLLFVRGFANHRPIFYLSFESSDALTAVIERSTFVPGLGLSSFPNADRDPSTARAAIFTFANGRTGVHSPPAQGLAHVIEDGHNAEDASLQNRAAIRALVRGGDAHNVFDVSPTLRNRRLARLYTPLWDLHVGVWSRRAVRRGVNVAQNDGAQIDRLARRGLVTAPGGLPLGSANIVINCPALAFPGARPTVD